MLIRIQELLNEDENFSFETTLATKSYRNTVLDAKKLGYKVVLLFLWLQTIELAKERVRIRVKEGGHNIPENVIERRFLKGIKNLFQIYLPIVDMCLIFDNSEGQHELIAQKTVSEKLEIINFRKFEKLKSYHDNY